MAAEVPGTDPLSTSPGGTNRLAGTMLIVHVQIHVRPECVAAFIEATNENARASSQEPGIARFDFVEQADDPPGSCWSRSTAMPTRRPGTRRRPTTDAGAMGSRR